MKIIGCCCWRHSQQHTTSKRKQTELLAGTPTTAKRGRGLGFVFFQLLQKVTLVQECDATAA